VYCLKTLELHQEAEYLSLMAHRLSIEAVKHMPSSYQGGQELCAKDTVAQEVIDDGKRHDEGNEEGGDGEEDQEQLANAPETSQGGRVSNTQWRTQECFSGGICAPHPKYMPPLYTP
jgi:hypothetical protein